MIIAILALLIIFLLSTWVDSKEAYVKENTSSTGVVVDKTYKSGHWGRYGAYGTKFFVLVERGSVNYFGEEVAEKSTRQIDYEAWTLIDVGDIATYNEDGSVIFTKPAA